MTTSPRYIRPKAAAAKLHIGLSTLWAWSSARHDFPKPVRLSARCTLFDENELEAWVQAQAR